MAQVNIRVNLLLVIFFFNLDLEVDFGILFNVTRHEWILKTHYPEENVSTSGLEV